MSIIRASADAPFSRIPYAALNDDRLSWEARGLLSYLLSKPNTWRVQLKDLLKQTLNAIGKTARRDKVYAILKELRAAGYITREFIRRDGEFKGVDYEISDTPDLEAGARYQAEQLSETPPRQAVLPLTEKPYTAKPEAIDKIEKASSLEKENYSPDPSLTGRPGNYPANPQATTYQAWHAYADAYRKRHKVWPILNAHNGGVMGKVVARVGDQAAACARYFVAKTLSDKLHPVTALLQDCETFATMASQAAAKKRVEQVEVAAEVAAVPAPSQRQGDELPQVVGAEDSIGRNALASLRGARHRAGMAKVGAA